MIEHDHGGASVFHHEWEEREYVLMRAVDGCLDTKVTDTCYEATDDLDVAAGWMINDPSASYYLKGRRNIESGNWPVASGWTQVTAFNMLYSDLLYEPSIARAMEIAAHISAIGTEEI